MIIQIRAGEDIVSMVRLLKEMWYYGKLDTLGENPQDIKRSRELEKAARAIEKVFEDELVERLGPEKYNDMKKKKNEKEA